MKPLYLKHTITGETKTVPMGFSFTTLFFGSLPLAFRGLWAEFIGAFLVNAVLFFTPNLAWAFGINRSYASELLRSGHWGFHPLMMPNAEQLTYLKMPLKGSLDSNNVPLPIEVPADTVFKHLIFSLSRFVGFLLAVFIAFAILGFVYSAATDKRLSDKFSSKPTPSVIAPSLPQAEPMADVKKKLFDRCMEAQIEKGMKLGGETKQAAANLAMANCADKLVKYNQCLTTDNPIAFCASKFDGED
jgi:hypothetical protein